MTVLYIWLVDRILKAAFSHRHQMKDRMSLKIFVFKVRLNREDMFYHTDVKYGDVVTNR